MNYDSNLTDSQWEIIKCLLDEQRKRKYSLRIIVDAILYITKSGVQWRLLPKDFPKWQLVYYYFRKWSFEGITEQIHERLLAKLREKKGKQSSPSLGLIDSQTVKTASVTKEKGIDGNKKISGRKRFIITDTLGLILAIFIAPANLGERAGAEQVLREMRGKYPRIVKIVADQGFDGLAFIERIRQNFGWIVEIVAKVAGLGGFQVLPKRWIVETTFAWLAFHRRLVKDYEVVVEHSTSFVHWTMIRLMLRKLV